MAEGTPMSPERGKLILPLEIGAVFTQGRLIPSVTELRVDPSSATGWSEKLLVSELDVTNSAQRNRWILENIRVYSDGTYPTPEVWHGVVTLWEGDLKTAADKVRLDKTEFEETRRRLLAVMAVSSSARAMEMTAGNSEMYEYYITGGPTTGRIDRDKQGLWREYLLHNDPNKLELVLSNQMVAHYYRKVLECAGITGVTEWEGSTPRKLEIDTGEAKAGKLVEYLRTQGAGEWKGGFNGLISDVLLADNDPVEANWRQSQLANGFDDRCLWAAAKLACDAVLVDLYTEWEYKVDRNGSFRLRPSANWDGDPLRDVLEPGLLPRRIGNAYRGENGKVILELLDQALRPEKLFAGLGLTDELLVPSNVVNLKKLGRWHDALKNTIGDTQASGLSMWDRKTTESLQDTANKLSRFYGTIKVDDPKDPRYVYEVGKVIVGTMMTRIVHLKALAAAQEVYQYSLSDSIGRIMGDDKDVRPLYGALVDLFGRDFKAKTGLFASWGSDRLGLVFDAEAKALAKDAFDILYTTDTTVKGRKSKAKFERFFEGLMTVSRAFAEYSRFTK